MRAPGGSGDDGREQHQHQRNGQLGLARKLLTAHFGVAGHVGHDDGDVVVAARRDSLVHQLRRAALRVLHAAQGILDLVVEDHARQAVGADEQAVAGFDVDLVDVGVEVRVAAQRARDHRTLRMRARLFGRELPGLDHVGHQAVVARELLELALVQQVRARVAYLGDDQSLAFQHGRGHGGSHALAAAPFARCLDDGAVRLLDGAAERFPVRMFGGKFGQHAHGYLGRHFACGVAAHAVGDGEQGRRDHEAVLVVIAKAADVGAAAERGERPLAGARSGFVRTIGGH